MKRGVNIELTSLLDVIMILMFLILLASAQKVEAAQTGRTDLEHENEILKSRLSSEEEKASALSRRLHSFDLFEENCLVLTISIRHDSEDSRQIIVENGMEKESVPLAWDNMLYAENSLRAVMSSYIRTSLTNEKQMAFIVFQYDRNVIYQSDYRLVYSVIMSEKQNENVYSAEYDISEVKNNE